MQVSIGKSISFSRIAIAGAIVGMLTAPLSGFAAMKTLNRSDLAGLNEVEGSGFHELYQHPDLGSLGFTKVYIAPVANEVPSMDIYDMGLRPYHFDALAESFHETIVAAFGDSTLLTDTPDENTLVIEVSLVEAARLVQETTGSHLANASTDNLVRGGAFMEMSWRQGPGGDLVMAIRDGRRPEVYDPVLDSDDVWTDAKGAFELWSADIAGFFGIEPQQVATN